MPNETPDLARMSEDEKKRYLFDRQKKLLDTFLAHGAIDRRQYEKSLGDLTVKMGMEPSADAGSGSSEKENGE